MKQQKFSIKEEPYEATDETSFKSFFNLANNNITANTNTKSFNLRKINANRVYLNSLSDKNVHNIPRVDEKLEAEKMTTNKLNSEKIKFLDGLKLKPIKDQINTSSLHLIKSTVVQPKLEKQTIDRNFETEFNTEMSLINQIIKYKELQVEPSESNKEKSKIDMILENKVEKSSNLSKNDFTDLKFKVSDNHENQSISCVYDYLFKIGGTSVSFECFQHVLFQLKHVKFMNNTNLSISFNPTPTTSSSAAFYKGNEMATISTSENNICQLGQQNSKFEFIYDESFYWVVKIRKIYNNLFQLKFMRSTSTTSSNENNSDLRKQTDLNNSNEIALNLDDLNLSDMSKKEISNESALNSPSSRTSSPIGGATNALNESSQLLAKCSNSSWYFSNETNSVFSKLLKKYLRPLGWSKKMGRHLKRPPLSVEKDLFQLFVHFNDTFSVDLKDESSTLFNSSQISSSFASKHYDFLNKLQENFYCELIDEHVPFKVHLVKIKRSVAGRLLIELNDKEFWLFYLDARLRPLGWAKSSKKFAYSNSEINSTEMANLTMIDSSDQLNKMTEGISIELMNHHKIKFETNFFMECLYRSKFYVARVIECVQDLYFILELDHGNSEEKNLQIIFYTDLNTNTYIIGNGGISSSNKFHVLFPCKWCTHNNLYIEPPKGWPQGLNFDWDMYLSKINEKLKLTASQPAYLTQFTDLPLFNWSRNLFQMSDKFQLGMYLECADEGGAIFLAQIKAKIGHLIFLKKNNDESLNSSSTSPLVYPIDSMNLFPAGWCEMNNLYDASNFNYSIKPFAKFKIDRQDILQIPYLSQFNLKKYWCENIYLNTRFHHGPFFLKSKLNALPKRFGPGPIVLVLQRLIQMLITASDKPFKLLKILQASRRNLNNINNYSPLAMKSKQMQRVRMKAKDKGKYNFRELEICIQQAHLKEYLNELCIKLKCCNKMITLEQQIDETKENSTTVLTNCINLQCCELCTVNYFSHWSDFLIDHLNNEQTTLSAAAITVNNTQTAISNPIKKKSNSITANNVKSNKLVKTSNSFNDNFSPIKTRFNVRQNLIFSMRQQQQQQLQYQQQQRQKQMEELKNKNDEINEKNKEILAEKRKTSIKTSNENGQFIMKKRTQSNEPAEKKYKKLSIVDNESMNTSLILKSPNKNDSQIIKSNPIQTSPYQSMSNRTSLSPSINNPVSNSNINYTNGSNQNSLISNANMSNIFSLTNKISSNLNKSNLNNKAAILGVDSNPIFWSAKDVCKYLTNNKFDSNLIYLIEEHEIDGQSFLMLNLPTIQNYMNLKLGPAIKLAHLVEKLKLVYFEHYQADSLKQLPMQQTSSPTKSNNNSPSQIMKQTNSSPL